MQNNICLKPIKRDIGHVTPFANKETQEKIKQTNLKRYGYTNPTSNKDISNKISKTRLEFSNDKKHDIINKTQKTNLEKYGIKSTLQVKKSRDTMKERYGAEYTGSSEILKQKMKRTCLEKYGAENIFRSTKIQQKVKLSWNKKTEEEKQKIYNKRKHTMKEKYGTKYYSQHHLTQNTLDIIANNNSLYRFVMEIPYEERCISNIQHKLGLSYSHTNKLITQLLKEYPDCKINYYISSFEIEFKKFLNTLNIDYIEHDRKLIYPNEIDFYIPKHNLAIECNGTYYHSTKIQNDINYHYKKSKLCEEKGIRLIHIFEYEWYNERQRPILENIIKNALGINKYKIYARNLDIEVRQSKAMRKFFDDNNIQGFRGGKFAICLVDKQTRECYMSYMFGKAFFGKGKYEYEVIRGATKLRYTIVGGASKIWKYFIDNYNPKSCVYYIDYNYFNGNSLKNIPNMKYVKTQSSFKNYFMESGIVKNRDPIHNEEINKLYEEGKVLKIYNAGTKVYVWKST